MSLNVLRMAMMFLGLKNEFEIACILDEPVHVLEQPLRCCTGVNLCGLYVGVS